MFFSSSPSSRSRGIEISARTFLGTDKFYVNRQRMSIQSTTFSLLKSLESEYSPTFSKKEDPKGIQIKILNILSENMPWVQKHLNEAGAFLHYIPQQGLDKKSYEVITEIFKSNPSIEKKTQDFLIKCGTRTFHTHLGLLTYHSHYFRSLLVFKEGDVGSIEFKGKLRLKEIIQYIEHNELPAPSSHDKKKVYFWIKTCHAANYLQCDVLKDYGQQKLIEEIEHLKIKEQPFDFKKHRLMLMHLLINANELRLDRLKLFFHQMIWNKCPSSEKILIQSSLMHIPDICDLISLFDAMPHIYHRGNYLAYQSPMPNLPRSIQLHLNTDPRKNPSFMQIIRHFSPSIEKITLTPLFCENEAYLEIVEILEKLCKNLCSIIPENATLKTKLDLIQKTSHYKVMDLGPKDFHKDLEPLKLVFHQPRQLKRLFINGHALDISHLKTLLKSLHQWQVKSFVIKANHKISSYLQELKDFVAHNKKLKVLKLDFSHEDLKVFNDLWTVLKIQTKLREIDFNLDLTEGNLQVLIQLIKSIETLKHVNLRASGNVLSAKEILEKEFHSYTFLRITIQTRLGPYNMLET